MAVTLLTLIIILVVTLAWLLATNSGARFLVNQAIQRAPGSVSAEDINGNLLKGLDIGRWRYTTEPMTLIAGRTRIAVDTSILWNLRDLTVETFTIDGLTIRQSGTEQTGPPEDIVVPALPGFSSPIRLAVNEFVIKTLTLETVFPDRVAVTVIDEIDLVAQMSGDRIDIARLDVDQANVTLSASGTLSLNSTLPINVTVDWMVANADERQAAGNLQLTGNRALLRIEHLLSMPQAIETSGTISALADQPVIFDLVNRADTVLLRQNPDVLRLLDATLAIRGKYSQWRLDLNASLDGEPRAAGRLEAGLDGQFQSFDVESAALRLADGGSILASGSVATGDALGFDGVVKLEQLPLALFTAAVEGEITGEYQVMVSNVDGWAVDAEIIETTGTINGKQFLADGIVRYKGQQIAFSDVTAVAGTNRVAINGVADTNGVLDLTAKVTAPSLAGFVSDLSGAANFDFVLSGTASQPNVVVHLDQADVVWQSFSVAGASGDIRWQDDKGDISLSLKSASDGQNTIAGLRLSGDGSLENHRVAVTATVNEQVRADLVATGGYQSERWSGMIERIDAEMLGLDPDYALQPITLTAPVALTMAANEFELSQACLTSGVAFDFCAAVGWRQQSLTLDATLEVAELQAFSRMALPAWQFDGGLTATANLAGPIQQLNGAGQVLIAQLDVSRAVVSEQPEGIETATFRPVQVDFTLNQGALDVAAVATVDQAISLQANMRLDNLTASDSQISGQITAGSERLDGLNGLLRSAVVTGGKTDIEFLVSGTRDQPAIRSDASIRDLNVQVLPLGIELKNINVSAVAENTRELAVNATGQSDQGKFSADTSFLFGGEHVFDMSGDLTASQFQFINLPDMAGVASMDLDIAANPEGYSVTGNLTVDKADIVVREIPADAARISADSRVYDASGELVEDTGAATLRGRLDLSLALSDQVNLAGFGLRTGLTGDLKLKQSPGNAPSGVGIIQLRDATYEAYGQSLSVSRGKLIFNGPLDEPRLDIRAQREVEDTVVGIDVTGTPSALSSSLFSTPALPDAEAFSLLLTGRNLAVANSGEGANMADAALTLGLRQALGVTDGIRKAVGLDSLTVAGSGRNGRLLAGKALSPNLYLQYAYGVFDQVSSVLLRLKINDRLSLESSSGATQSVDLIYSVGRKR